MAEQNMSAMLGGAFQRPAPQPTFGQRLGRAVKGFGAGLAGAGPQYLAQLQQQEQQLSEERKAAMAQDAFAVRNLLAENRVDDAIRVVGQRSSMIQELGGDSSDTDEIYKMLISGKSRDAMNELDSFLSMPEVRSYLPQPEKLEQFTLSPGEVRFNERGQVVAKGAERPESDLARKRVQWLKPDGSIQTLETDQRGSYFTPAGSRVNLPDDAILTESNLAVTDPNALNIPAAEKSELTNREVATRSLTATVGDMLQMLQENPDINTFVSSAAGFANNVAAEAMALGRALGMEDEVSRLTNPETFSSTFNELGIRNRQMQSLVQNLAYTVARSNDPGGRLSDTDVQRAVREIGASASDPAAFSRVLMDVARRANRNFEIEYKTRTGADFRENLMEPLSGFMQQPAASTEAPTVSTAEQYDALPSGAIYTDPQGNIRVKQ